MTKLSGLMPMSLYRKMLIDKYIRVNKHPTLPLSIVNYTEKAQFDNEWNKVTRQCRGLIIDDKLNVIARPFDKFLNYGQETDDHCLLDSYRVEVTDKMDGSLGIIFEYHNNWYVATRGSFVSDQAIWATKFLNTAHKGYKLDLWHEETYLVEIIYPGNRIVLNYGDQEDLVLLAARNAITGSVRPAKDVEEWYGPKTTTFPYKTLREAIEAVPRPNAEGYVIYFPDLDYRIKLKQEDYVLLHKIVTGLTKRRIWENMKEGKTLEELCSIVPDEWHEWLRSTYQVIFDAYWDTYTTISAEFHAVELYFQGVATRKEFALYVKDSANAGLLFALLDNKDIANKVWDLVRPEAE